MANFVGHDARPDGFCFIWTVLQFQFMKLRMNESFSQCSNEECRMQQASMGGARFNGNTVELHTDVMVKDKTEKDVQAMSNQTEIELCLYARP